MLDLKYIGLEEIYPVSFTLNTNSLVTIQGDVPIKETGFNIYLPGNEKVLGDYSTFVTVYREIDGGVMYSNDGSVYVEPEPIPDDDSVHVEPEPIPGSDPYIPTYKEVLALKISELEAACVALVNDGVIVNGEHYTYTSTQRTDLKELFDTVSKTGLPIGYENAEGVCREYTAEEIVEIYVAQLTNKYGQETYKNQVVLYLKNLEETDENKSLIAEYVYGTELIGEYLVHYNEMLALYQAQLEALMG